MEFLKIALLLSCIASLGVFANEVSVEVNDALLCEGCELINEALLDMLGDEEVEQEIANFLVQNWCSLFKSGSEDCISNIKNYGISGLKKLAGSADPKAICRLVKVCGKASNDLLPVTSVDAVVPEANDPENFPFQCFLCKFVAKAVSKIVDVHKTEDKIVQKMDKICNHVFFFKTQCHHLVDNYFKKALDDIIQKKLSPDHVCQTFDLCPNDQPQ